MATITLTQSTGFPLADTVVRGIVTLFESVYPKRVIGYCVEGSCADQTAVSTSDLDLTLVFASSFASAADQELARQLVQACGQLSALELDLTLADEP